MTKVKHLLFRFSLSWILLLVISFIWFLFYQAGNLPYDDNYANLLSAIFISAIICLVLVLLSVKRRQLLISNFIMVLVFLITSSPVSLFYVALNYKAIFGTTLAV